MKLTLQIYVRPSGWVDAGEVAFLPSGETRVEYDIDFVSKYLGCHDLHAFSLTFPVQLPQQLGPTPGFLVDLVPQGKPLKLLLGRHGIRSETDYQSILSKVPLASPGNIRIREPWQQIDEERRSYAHRGFSRAEVVAAKQDFLEYMEKHGAPIGGTSGAAGGAPKFLLREDHSGHYHADGYLDDALTKTAWLIKFPFTDSENAKLLVRTEKSYYDVLRKLPLVTGAAIEIEEDILFIERFDRVRGAGKSLHYLGLESLYSAHGINTYGVPLTHEENILLIQSSSTQPLADICEYLKRDLVCRALANVDNHGRNTSFIKDISKVTLSPLYDVTAMQFFEGDFILPLTRWSDRNQSLAHRLRWVTDQTQSDYDAVVASVVALRTAMSNLHDLLLRCHVPASIVSRSEKNRSEVMVELQEI